MSRIFLAACAFSAGLLTGCSKPPPPKPDGSSGISGVCLLPAEPPDENGKVPDRKRWAGVRITVEHANHSSDDPTWGLKYQTTANENGTFEVPLNPGHYLVSPYDPALLKDMAISVIPVKVEPGQFTAIVIDYDKLEMQKVILKRP